MTRPMPQYAVHYCGNRHNPKYPCPATPIRFGGVSADRLPKCSCEELDHDEDCPRRRAIVTLMNRRDGR
jgi:hypothetical protein